MAEYVLPVTVNFYTNVFDDKPAETKEFVGYSNIEKQQLDICEYANGRAFDFKVP